MKRWLFSVAVLVLAATSAPAHFIWIVPDAGSADSARVVFSDALEPDENVAIDKIAAVKLNLRDAAGKTLPVELKKDKNAFLFKTPAPGAAVVAGACEYGVLQKGAAKPFLLVYHPKWVRGNVHAAARVDKSVFEIVGKGEGNFVVLFEGKPLAGAEVNVMGENETITANAEGAFKLKSAAGLHGIRAKHVQARAGEAQGKKYDEIRHYATLVFEQPKVQAKVQNVPALPEGFSSFGAAVSEGHVYVYGGHIGKTHNYSTETVTDKFRRLNLAQPAKGWEELPTGPRAQGLALVAHGGKLYRIGGMQPRNKPGDPADNVSLAECAVFDPKVGKWAAMPSLPAGRSSHDATVVGDLLVVAGGWQMHGAGKKAVWHKDTLVLDLAKKDAAWQSIPQPFARRALNVAALDNKVYVVCGMNADNETEKRVDVLDLTTRQWTTGPALPGSSRNGFTPAVCNLGGRIYASPSDGKVYRLNSKHTTWEEIATLERQRVVHRIVPVGEDTLLVLGGASRAGNVAQSEVIEISLEQ